jgi:hypothetical protein
MQIHGKMFAPVLALILSSFACSPSESALIVNVTNWPGDAAKLRLLVTFDGKPGQTSFIAPGTPQFSIVVLTGQTGQAVVEGMVQDSAGCYTAGTVVTADFAGNQGVQLLNVELSLSPYSTKACQASFPVEINTMYLGYLHLWGDRPDNYWLANQSANATLRWDGSVWVSISLPGGGGVSGTWGSSSGDVWAMSLGGIGHWAGSAWFVVPSAASVSLFAAWGSSSTDVWAVGGTAGGAGAILHWDGIGWATVPLPASQAQVIVSVWGSSSTDVWAVGYISSGAGLILHWDGVAWTTIPSPASQYPHSVWGSSSTDVWVVANNSAGAGLILHWGGTAWATVPAPVSGALYSVWGRSSRDVWAVGSLGSILHWNGTAWAIVPSPALQILDSVWGSSGSDVWAVGATSANLLTALHWGGASWTAVF